MPDLVTKKNSKLVFEASTWCEPPRMFHYPLGILHGNAQNGVDCKYMGWLCHSPWLPGHLFPHEGLARILSLSEIQIRWHHASSSAPYTWVSSYSTFVYNLFLDTYFHVKFRPEFWHSLRFKLNGTIFQFCVIPLGLKFTPYLFTKLTRAITAFCNKWGVHLIFYLLITIILNCSRAPTFQYNFVLQMLCFLGFIVNLKKSDLSSWKCFIFLGLNWNSADHSVVHTGVSAGHAIPFLLGCPSLSRKSQLYSIHAAPSQVEFTCNPTAFIPFTMLLQIIPGSVHLMWTQR